MGTSALCGIYDARSDAAVDRLVRMAEFMDYKKHCTCAPIARIEAYWLVQAKSVRESGAAFPYLQKNIDLPRCV